MQALDAQARVQHRSEAHTDGRLNRTCMNYLEEFQRMIDEYNSGVANEQASGEAHRRCYPRFRRCSSVGSPGPYTSEAYEQKCERVYQTGGSSVYESAMRGPPRERLRWREPARSDSECACDMIVPSGTDIPRFQSFHQPSERFGTPLEFACFNRFNTESS